MGAAMRDKRRLWVVIALLPFAGAWAFALSEPPRPKRTGDATDQQIRAYFFLLSKTTGGVVQLADPTHPRWKGEFPAIPDGKRVGEEEVDKIPVTVIEAEAPGISLFRWSFGKKDGILRQEVFDLGLRV